MYVAFSSLCGKKRKSRCVLTWCGIECGADNWLPFKYVYDAETYGIVLLKFNGLTMERNIGEASGGHRAQLKFGVLMQCAQVPGSGLLNLSDF